MCIKFLRSSSHGFLVAAEKGKQVSAISVTKLCHSEEKDMGAYLMVFHRDETHGLYTRRESH